MLQDILNFQVLQNAVRDYLIALATLFLGVLIIHLVRVLIVNRLKRWARKTGTWVDENLIQLFVKYLIPIAYLGLFYISIQTLTLNPTLAQAVHLVGIILLTLLGISWLSSLAEYGLRFYWMTRREANPTLERSLNALVPALRIVIWAIGVVFLLSNLGFDISAVVAGLGIGGVAVALASQGILKDLFSYMSILFDRPFELGDFIIVGEFLGTVEHIGIKTTRLRSLGGEQLIISNTDLTEARVRNYRRMQRRRVVFSLGVTYETGLSQLQIIPEMIRSIIEQTDDTTFDRAHFSEFGDYSLNFEVVYYVTSSDYNTYMDAQQHINLNLIQTFRQKGIELAYPTHIAYLSQQSGQEQDGNGSRAQTAQTDRKILASEPK
jgi:small-conductance mechanosensitive channel